MYLLNVLAELSPDERTQVLEKYWNDGSLSMWLATFPEMFFDEAVSAVVSDFVRDKMRKRLRTLAGRSWLSSKPAP